MTPPPPDLVADRWGSRWSSEGAVLAFSDGRLGASIRLEPQLAAQLAARLSDAVAAHERLHGTLWSEENAHNGGAADARLRWAGSPAEGTAGDALYLLVKNLPLQGFERSFKLQPGHLLARRFLAGIPTAALAAADVDFIARQMNAPEAYREQLMSRLRESSYVHFGFEEAPGRDTLKLYLEFARMPSSQGPGGTTHPLYLGFKWDASDPSQRAVSTYSQPQPAQMATLADKIGATFGTAHRLPSDVATDIVRLAETRAGANALSLVEVTEDNSPRVSFDVNLYAAGLRLEQLLPLLAPLTAHFGIDDGAMAAVAGGFGGDLAGHISGGLDRHGQPFLTIYHALAI